MPNTLVNLYRLTVLLSAFGLSAIATGCATTVTASPPPCPPPGSGAIASVERMMEAEERGPHGNENLLIWIAEIERYCRSLRAYLE